MEQNTVIKVWNEITISADGIGITLYSESVGDGARVEDETWFTFDELETLHTGDIVNLNLSDETAEQLVEGQQSDKSAADVWDEMRELQEEIEQSEQVEQGDVLIDENAPDWSEDDRVVVEEVLDDVSCYEYVIEGPHEGSAMMPAVQAFRDSTVADANPSYNDGDSVILATYEEGSDTYAFPESRLVKEEPADSTMTDAFDN